VTEHVSVELKRSYPIDSKKLYELITTPKYMERWFSPAPEIQLRVLKHSAEVGAPYEFNYRMPDGEVHLVVGEYCALSPHDLIAFTWGWREPDPHAGVSTLVTMTLKETGSETELTVLHEQLHAGDMAERHSAGWQGTLERLDVLVLGHQGATA
jgi:uncharacterized protein YndB with AHSA1/START domain